MELLGCALVLPGASASCAEDLADEAFMSQALVETESAPWVEEVEPDEVESVESDAVAEESRESPSKL